ncbi:MAG: hypothetical protein OEY49_06360 [Candidatus Heimdallarchaeota archaeon]|nr:hypothetical protein [Candidatus Heimdallarchaeota archaeon]
MTQYDILLLLICFPNGLSTKQIASILDMNYENVGRYIRVLRKKGVIQNINTGDPKNNKIQIWILRDYDHKKIKVDEVKI